MPPGTSKVSACVNPVARVTVVPDCVSCPAVVSSIDICLAILSPGAKCEFAKVDVESKYLAVLDLIEVVKGWFDSKGLSNDERVIDALNYSKARTSKVFSADRATKVIKIALNYDLASWSLNPQKKLSDYKLSAPTKASFTISDDQYDELERQLKIYGKKLK